jgi:hypothetical protein
MPSPPPIPARRVVVYDCLSNDVHILGRQPLRFGTTNDCDIQLGSLGLVNGKMELSRSGKKLEFTLGEGQNKIDINGVSFDGGLLPVAEEFSLAIDKRAFFLVCVGENSHEWGEQMGKSPQNSWKLFIIEGGDDRFNDWKKKGCPSDYPKSHSLKNQSLQTLYDEVAKRNWDQQVGIIYHSYAKAGFFASQFLSLAHPDQIPDAGENRCPRCWMRFETGRILAIHPSELGDEKLGRDELKRFVPRKFDFNSIPLTDDGRPCTRLACPHCRGELPPNILEKPPHMLSIVGDSMVGKSYFLTVAVNQLKRTLKTRLDINFTDADPKGNEILSNMVSRLFSPTDKPEETFLGKTQLAGATYKEFQRYGKMVRLPAPFTYNLSKQGKGSASVVLYDNAGEHFRPGNSEEDKSNAAEHIAWASGILFLFDPIQHRDLLRIIDSKLDPQIAAMKAAAKNLMFDQDVILGEMGARLRGWRQIGLDELHDAPIAVVVGKHDLLGDLLPIEKLTTNIYAPKGISQSAIDENSNITREFMLEYCSDIVGAAESISKNVKYFPASSFGVPATVLDGVTGKDGKPMYGPNPSRMKPYLVEAPFLWLLSEMEPELIFKS